jgi:hypothetical protein
MIPLGKLKHSGRKSPADEYSDPKSGRNILIAISEGLSNSPNRVLSRHWASFAVRSRVEWVQAALLAALPTQIGGIFSHSRQFSRSTISRKRENGNLQKHRKTDMSRAVQQNNFSI